MRKNIRLLSVVTACLLVFAALAGCASKPDTKTDAKAETKQDTKSASKYPEKNIEFIVPMSAGGGSDIFCRQLVKIIEDKKLCPKPIVVVNKPGASGAIGWSYVANDKKGDPYVISTTSSSFYTNPVAGASPVSYKNFTHIINTVEDPRLLVVAASSQYKTVQDLVGYAKANPGKLTCGGSSGVSQDAILFYGLKEKSGTDMKYVPFSSDGTDPTTTLMGGHIDFAWLGVSEIIPQLEAGKLRAIGVGSEDRLKGAVAAVKDIPTLKEQGYDLVLTQLRGIVAPPGIPEDAVGFLQDMFKKAIETPEWKEFVKTNGSIERILTGKDFEKASAETNDICAKYISLIKK